MKKKVTIVVVIVLVIVLIAACVMWRIGGVETESALGDHQKYVYAYVSSIEGNEVTYMEVDELVAKAAEERAKEKAEAEDDAGSDSTEQSGQMQMPPDMDSTEMPQGAPGGMSDDRRDSHNYDTCWRNRTYNIRHYDHFFTPCLR